MNPILLARHVQESLRELVHTTLNTTSHAFEGTVDRFLDQPGNFIKGPWISVDMPFRQIDGAADGAWVQPFPEVPLRFAPYQHQTDAFARLGGEGKHSTLVATGTGSGKTESYLWPILDHCRRNKGKPGIKAILIYPMNALATDQARRIAAAITEIGSLDGVRAGIYADAEPKNATHAVTADSIITHRETMRRNPPDILLTNYKMLDYLLLRGRDKPLWGANDPESLRFLVVDEMHTFDGAQGADLALLLRRLKYRLGTPKRHLVCDLYWLGRKLAAWQVTTAYPVAMQIGAADIEANEKRDLFRMIYSYIVRRALSGLTSKNLNRVFQSLSQAFVEKGPSAEALEAYFAQRTGDSTRFPGDREFQQGILSKPAYTLAQQTRIKDVLWELEEASRTKFSEKTAMPEGLWTEHVLPVSWTEEWPFEEYDFVERWSNDPKAETRNRVLHTLGNLTLLTGSLNISSGNKEFLEKRGKLEEHTGLFLNKWFLKKDEWNEAQIRERGEALADMALNIWPTLEVPEILARDNR